MLVVQLTIQMLFQYVQRLFGIVFEHKQIHFPQKVKLSSSPVRKVRPSFLEREYGLVLVFICTRNRQIV